MPPKKREKESDGQQKGPRNDQIQADHELFLQAFEKPTQIYRFLRTRNQISPIFLFRNLSYMRQRMSRSHKSRENFKVNSILHKKTQRNNAQKPSSDGGRRYMTLTFLGFYDKKLEEPQDQPVKVETLLLTICHKKRKDVSSPIMQVSVGTSEVPINPSENQPAPKAPSINIPNESFSLNNGHVTETYMLLLRVYCMSNSNNCLMHNCDLDEPAQKRRKTTNGVVPLKVSNEEVKLYGSELIVYDKHNRCLLTDGDYELGLQEVQTNVRSSPKKQSFWETIPEITDCEAFDTFGKSPTLKFRLTWINEIDGDGENKNSVANGDNKENQPGNNDGEKCSNQFNNNNSTNNNNNTTLSNSSLTTPSKMSVSNSKRDESSGPQQIVYQFLYNNNSRQQTEACEDLHCPWCSLDCGKLYSLLKHLKLCHSRFTFTYVPIPQGARIDVAINECYDGSYAGSPHELISQPSGVAFSRAGPTRRTSVTNILVCRPKRTKPSLSEFLELDENEFESQRPYITGHNRLYHHTVTCLPIYPKEMDIDSEGENDPKWLQTKTMMMIDDFTDVNEGEKELMKMWNLHVMKYGYVGDCQIPLACQMFLEFKGKELIKKNLYRNFVLHMSSLFDFGLISPVVLYQTIQKLQEIMKEEGEDGDLRKVLQKSHESQVRQWAINGMQGNVKRETSMHVSNGKHAGTSKLSSLHHAGNKSTIQNGLTKGTTTAMNSSGKSVGANSMSSGQQNELIQRQQTNNEIPTRRKSTHSVESVPPMRRKTTDGVNNTEYHRRKLVLDVIPYSIQKSTQNASS